MSGYSKTNGVLGSVNRGDSRAERRTPHRTDGKGKCETRLALMKGRRISYPPDIGITAAQ